MEEALAVIDRALEECRARSAWAASDVALIERLDAAYALAAMLAAVQLALLREVDGRAVAVGQGATGTVAWVRDRYRLSPGAATRQVTLAATLDAHLPATARALAAGTVEQAQAIAAAVADLPAAHRPAADTHLAGVLDTTGQVLDLGRERRLFTGPLRRALILRDHGCAFPGCDRPPRWCDGHHIIHWADGGKTSLDNAVLLCGHHHRLLHHSPWQVHLNPTDGLPEFTPPTYLDQHQRPQRNRYHRRQ